MTSYSVCCYRCGEPAVYKIAAEWSDGVTRELKTYGIVCEACLEFWFRQSRERQAACRLTPGETLGGPGIYVLARGRRDRELIRRTELEERLSAGP
jgi:hypothetical protein